MKKQLNYMTISHIVEVTPYAVNTPIETVIFNIEFAYISDKTEYAKKTLEINTDSMYDRIFNQIKDNDIFPKHKYYVNLPKSKSSNPTCLVLKSVVLLDADRNHLRIGKVNKGIKMLFRCSERLIHLTGSRIETSRRQENKLCTKEDFMTIKKQIGGLDDVIDQIYSSLILTRLNQEKSEELGLKLNMGAIFVGPPGTGKSALASLIADTLNGKLTFVKGKQKAKCNY
jgi:ATP-dependent Zn protease